MMSVKCAVVIFAVFACSQAAQLPSYFTQCPRQDSDECIKESANKGIETYVKGDKSVHVVPLNPLHVTEMIIDVDGNLKINITNAEISGLESARFESVKWDWDNKKVHFDIRIPRPALVGTYDIAGRILILPINGQGPCNITYINGLFKYSFEYEIVERNGKEYINMLKNSMPYQVDRAYFHLDNLFNGDKRLGEEMNKFLDENWKEVNEEIGARVGDALSEVFTAVINAFMAKVPLKHLFG